MKLLRYLLGWLCIYPRNTKNRVPGLDLYLSTFNSPKIHR